MAVFVPIQCGDIPECKIPDRRPRGETPGCCTTNPPPPLTWLRPATFRSHLKGYLLRETGLDCDPPNCTGALALPLVFFSLLLLSPFLVICIYSFAYFCV